MEQLLGLKLRITSHVEEVLDDHSMVINYSNKSDIDGYQINPDGLLFEEKITAQKPTLGQEWNGLPTIVFDDNRPFDVLSASFFLVSRYEEYLPYNKDAHHRFPATESCLLALNLLHRPIVNEWALALLSDLQKKYPEIDATPRKFEYLSTIDIDQAWKFKNKGLLRNTGGLFRDFVKQQWDEVSERLQVFFGDKEDPFYNFDWQDEVHQQYLTDVQYFIQVGSRGKFDKNTSIDNAEFQQLIKRLDARYPIGIHPSYQSNDHKTLVRQEHHSLENVVGHDIEVSRQHFLMHSMPSTYHTLLDSGIRQDHTMGYSTHLGFRAGIAAPFPFFDLTKNAPTKLVLIPFCCMDITPLHYMEQTPNEAINTVSDLMESVRKVGGLFVSLWHNESLGESGRWIGWRKVYKAMIQECSALLTSKD